jgi:hypothetical protein
MTFKSMIIMEPIITKSCTVVTAEGPIRVFVSLNTLGTYTASVLHYYVDKPQAPHFIEATKKLACDKCSAWIKENFTPPFILN